MSQELPMATVKGIVGAPKHAPGIAS
jgi:hypothetical protein